MKLLDSPRRRWYLLAAGWVALLVLGVGGFLQQSQEGDLDRSFLDNVYLTLQLAALDYSGGSSDMNWRLQIARFVAPVMALGTVLQAASVVFRDEYVRWRMRFLKGHIVVCGLGPAGSRLAEALAREGQRVVAVEPSPGAPGAATVRDHDIPVLFGSPSDPDVLRAVRADRAARVVALTATDAGNVAVAAACRQVSRDPHQPALRCSVALADSDLVELLRGGELGGTTSVRVEFFNLHARAARALLAEAPAFGDGARVPHVAVLGLGRLGRGIVVAVAQQWAEVGSGPLRLTLVDRDASGRLEALRLQHPALSAAIDAHCLDMDLDAPSAEAVDAFTRMLREDRPTMVAVAFDDESLALSTGIFVHRTVDDPSVPVVVRTDADTGISAIVAAHGDEPEPFPGLVLFPFLDRACSPEVVEGGVREQLARSLHEDHTARTGSGAGLHRAWRELSDDERESSRRAADGVVDGLAGLGYELVPLRRWGVVTVSLSDRDVDLLAAAEHERWRSERTRAGWTYGPVRDDATRQNPLLVPWGELEESAREQNREGIRAMPALLARAGFEVSRAA
ncbi:MAG: NAD-binding protein [Candidatus Nanopelagicales bacterium]